MPVVAGLDRARAARSAQLPASSGTAVEKVDTRKLRPIEQVFDCPSIDRAMRRFVDWIAQYTLSPPGMVARMLLRAPEAFDPEPWIEGLQRTFAEPDRMTAARTRVLETAEDGLAWTRSGLAHAAGVSSTVIDGLKAQGVFEAVMISVGDMPLPITLFMASSKRRWL
jgi:primosomal protein N' (replication factor Y)